MKADKIIGAVQGVTKRWAKQRKAEERNARAIENRQRRLTSYRVTIKDVAYDVMDDAYMKASANGTLPANARQIMYAARPIIQAETAQQLDDQYFTQQLLPNYMAEHDCADWDVVFDDRGHFTEPHTGTAIGLGTLAVRRYVKSMGAPALSELAIQQPTITTAGPEGRYSAALFCEKEGFNPLWESAQLAERYDIAIMSTKGQSVTAARRLVDALCQRGVRVFTLHDFDKSGFSILGGLSKSTRRYQYNNGGGKVIDLGLRLADVNALGLDPEAAFDRGSDYQRRANLRSNGATPEEIEFLLKQRVELNAMASDQLVEWVESKLVEHGVAKVIPDDQALALAYRRMHRQALVQVAIDKALAELGEHDALEMPPDLADRIAARLRDDPAMSWDEALLEIMGASA